MISSIKKCIKQLFVILPQGIWACLNKIIAKKINPETLELIQLERYARYLIKHFDEECVRIGQNQRCMIIRAGDYSYSYFNIAYINNVLALILYSLYSGCVPVIQINQDEQTFNKWDWYFKQPHIAMGIDISEFEKVECDILNHSFKPTMNIVYDMNGFNFKFWRFMLKRFVTLNNETEQYVTEEIEGIGNPQEMIGVLLRGTDYIKLKPKGHPVQPMPEEIVSETVKRYRNGNYKAVYVATEEKRLYDMVSDAVGAEHTRENKRQYYDHMYSEGKDDLIGRIHFDRENDNYLKGIEYLSSLIILSRCKTLVAGNCGGTLFAMLMSNYDNPHVFNYGVY